MSSARAIFAFMSSTWGATLGSWHIITESILSIVTLRGFRCHESVRSSSMLLIFLYRSSVSGNIRPMSPIPAAPSIESMIEWTSTSASECPWRPNLWSIFLPPRVRLRPVTKGCTSKPFPILRRSIRVYISNTSERELNFKTLSTLELTFFMLRFFPFFFCSFRRLIRTPTPEESI